MYSLRGKVILNLFVILKQTEKSTFTQTLLKDIIHIILIICMLL